MKNSNIEHLDRLIAAQRERLANRPQPKPKPHVHQWGMAYKSSGGRRVCVECGHVTDKPFETLGVAESEGQRSRPADE